MADYNIYGIKRTDINEFIYIGMTEREREARWEEHRRAVGGVYKRSCASGKKGDVRNPNTPYGMEANKPLYHFIRNELGDNWEFVKLEGDDKMTEKAWIDLALSWGHRLFNMVDGQGKFITERTYAGVDLSKCKDAGEAVELITAWQIEALRKEQEAKAEILRQKKEDERKRLAAKREEIENEIFFLDKYINSIDKCGNNMTKMCAAIAEVDEPRSLRIMGIYWGYEEILNDCLDEFPADIDDFRARHIFLIGRIESLKRKAWRHYFNSVKIAENQLGITGLFGGELE